MATFSKLLKKITSASVLLCILHSCNILEDRLPCPCYLVFVAGDKVNTDAEGHFTVMVAHSGTKETTSEISWKSFKDDDYEIKVSKGEKHIIMFSGRKKNYLTEDNVLIAKGDQCDSIHASFFHGMFNTEKAEVPLNMFKQYSSLNVKLKGEKSYPLFIRVKGGIDGINLSDLKPHHGSFDFKTEALDDNGCEFNLRLPRQDTETVSGLLMEIYSPASTLSSEDYLVDTIPLGDYLTDTGFDWNEKNLKDIYIELEFRKASFNITVNDWIFDKERIIKF